MSNLKLNKIKNLHNESAQSFVITQDTPNHAIDMELDKKETVTPGPVTAAKKDFVSIDVIEDRKEYHSDTINEDVGADILPNTAELKVHITSPAAARQKSRIWKFYDTMVAFREQQRLARKIRLQKQTPQLPQEMLMSLDGLTKSQETLQAPGYLPDLGYLDSQGCPKEGDQGHISRLRGGYEGGGDDRGAFIAVVLTITFVMLAFTAIFIGVILVTPELKSFFKKYTLLLIIPAAILLLIVQCTFVYSECARRLPINFILLFITMFAMSTLAATISCKYKTDLIFLAILCTAIIVGICCILACTSFDFTSYLIYVVAIALAFTAVSVTFFGVRLITGEKYKMMHLIMLLVGTLIQIVVLIIELQMILGGKSIELKDEDYALGAFMLYTSIMNIFIKMLQLMGEISD